MEVGEKYNYVTYSYKIDCSYNSAIQGEYEISVAVRKDSKENYSCAIKDENIKQPLPPAQDQIVGYRDSTAKQLRNVISTWYFILRNLALLVLMLLLIYSGIRIVIGSTAGEKAKYKERLVDWLVAVCLVMIMHYIMVFAVTTVSKVTELVNTLNHKALNAAYIPLSNDQLANSQDAEMKRIWLTFMEDSDGDGYSDIFVKDPTAPSGRAIVWQTDLAGFFRIQAELEKEGTSKWIGYSICYIILVLFTLFFAVTYAKRVIYMAFLTIISPLVAMTYPIDKITDGKAQAFNMWLKEYIFNLMIQPLHLLLYILLISSAFELASKNAVYAIVAIGFMMPAEKIMRRFFGFEKAKTPGLLGAAAGAALAMTGLQRLMGHRPPPKGGNASSYYNNREETKSSINFSREQGASPFETIANSNNGNMNTLIAATETPETEKSTPTAKEPSTQKTSVGKKATGTSKTEELQEVPAVRTPEIKEPTIPTPILDKYDGKNYKKDRRLKRTIKGVSSAYFRGLGNKALRNIKNGHPVRALARGATGLFGGALFATAGLSLGIASGDPSKALQYTGIGMAGGYGLGKGVAGSVVDTLSVDNRMMEKELEQSWYGEEYIERQLEKDYRKDLISEKNIDRIRTLKGWTRKQAIDFLNNEGKEYYDNGIREVDEMLAIEKTLQTYKEEKEKQIQAGHPEKEILKGIPTREEAIAASKLKSMLPMKINSMTKDKKKEYIDTYAEKYKPALRKKYPTLNEKQIENIAERKGKDTIRFMENLNSAKSSLTKVKKQ